MYFPRHCKETICSVLCSNYVGVVYKYIMSSHRLSSSVCYKDVFVVCVFTVCVCVDFVYFEVVGVMSGTLRTLRFKDDMMS